MKKNNNTLKAQANKLAAKKFEGPSVRYVYSHGWLDGYAAGRKKARMEQAEKKHTKNMENEN